MLTRNRQVVLLLLFTSLLTVSCKRWTQRGAKGTGLLPKAPAGETKFSSYRPKNPYTALTAGMMTRTLFSTSSRNGYHVEVRDLIVGPGQHSKSVALPGAAVFEVRSGNGVMTAGESKQELKLGTTFSLAEGERFSIENKSDSPLAMRVYLFQGE